MAADQPRTPDDLPPLWRVIWQDRASQRVFDGFSTRTEAERAAFREILEWMAKSDQSEGDD